MTKNVSILCCVLRATGAKYCKIHRWFSGISDSVVQKHMFWASPRRGTDARTDARTRGGIIRFELSPLKRCMRINSSKGCPGVTESDWEWSQRQEEERGGRNVREAGQSEEREWKVYGFSWEVLIFADFTYGFSWEVLKFTISTSHFMVCFGHLTKKVSILCCVLRATVAKYCKIHRWFSGISDSMVQKHMFWASPRRGTDARTDGRTHAGIISFELSPLKRCMRIKA